MTGPRPAPGQPLNVEERHVEHEADERPLHERAGAPAQAEPPSGDLRRALEIQDTEVGPEVVALREDRGPTCVVAQEPVELGTEIGRAHV